MDVSQMDLRQQKIMILTKLANDFSTLVSRLDRNNGNFPQKVQMARICALSTRSPNLVTELREIRDHLRRWLDINVGTWVITDGVNRASLISLFTEAIGFFEANGIEGTESV